jgi:spore coat protein U-like protein
MTSPILKTLVILAALGMAPVAMAAQNSATKSATASTNITSGIAIAKTKDLNFATIVPGAAVGTVTVSTTNVRTFTGPLTFGNGATSNASFNVTHPGGTFGSTYGLVLPASVTITSGSNSMVVDNFTWGYFWVSFIPILVQVDVGATLHVGASQPVGTYTGTFNVTVTEQ